MKASAKRSAPAEGGASSGGYWVQVGAFVEEKNAEALSKQLKGENFPVTISRISRGGSAAAPTAAPVKPADSGGQNQLFITGSTADAVNAALKGKGTAQPVKGGLVVNPSYDLETAMSLSSALKKEGFKVVIRRAKATPAAAPAPSGGGDGTVYHVVRVGGYPDRAKALQVRTELEAKGHPGFLAQGAAR
jgi:cell division septation protein DedD